MRLNIIFNLLIISIIFSNSCSDESNKIFNPTFDNLINFSLTSRTYNLEDIAKRHRQISVDSGKYLLRFSTDEVKKDTILNSFTADFFTMNVDTTFYVFVSDTIDAQIIIRRDSVYVEEAEIESGLIKLRFTNHTNKLSFFQMSFPGFTKTVGTIIDTLKIGGSIPPNQTITYSEELNGYHYKQPDNQPSGITNPGFWIKGKIHLQGGTWGDSVYVLSNVEDIKFRRMKGKFKPFSLGEKTQTSENSLSRDLADFIANVQFDSVQVLIDAFSSINFPVKLKNFSVIGKFKSNKPPIRLLFGNRNFIDTIITSNGQILLDLNNRNTNINSFLSQVPDSITISSELILNPFYQSGEVLFNDTLSFSFKVIAWSRFAVDQAVWTDTFDIDISQDVRNKLKRARPVDECLVIMNTENEIPLETHLVGIATDSNYNSLFYLTRDRLVNNDTMTVIQGAFTDFSGNVIGPRFQNIQIKLTNTEMEKLSRAYFLIQRFNLSTTNRSLAEVSAKAKLKLNINGRLRIQLTKDDF